MRKTLGCLCTAFSLAAACPSPANAGWNDAYVWYGRPLPTVVLYAQPPVGPVRWRVFPRHYQTLYWPAGYGYQADSWYRPLGWAGCAC
jgi:hypothetical protein